MSIPEQLKIEIMFRSNNSCCICQTPFIQIHHIDGKNQNHEQDNLAPLCPNCHSQANSKSYMTLNLTPERIKKIRDRWYLYCEDRKLTFVKSPNAMMKLKLFIRDSPYPTYSWKKTFAFLHPSYEELNREQIAERVFSTSNPDDLKTGLNAVLSMYKEHIYKRDNEGYKWSKRFKDICNSFGFDYNIDKREVMSNSQSAEV